jgi:hypothetical protein
MRNVNRSKTGAKIYSWFQSQVMCLLQGNIRGWGLWTSNLQSLASWFNFYHPIYDYRKYIIFSVPTNKSILGY